MRAVRRLANSHASFSALRSFPSRNFIAISHPVTGKNLRLEQISPPPTLRGVNVGPVARLLSLRQSTVIRVPAVVPFTSTIRFPLRDHAKITSQIGSDRVVPSR